ncbi:MAG TPA: hypothetical protein DD400_02970 [Rhodospirillaceae bacterium]|nr:hypothetical protein [Rhodospirillaceae bacterium]
MDLARLFIIECCRFAFHNSVGDNGAVDSLEWACVVSLDGRAVHWGIYCQKDGAAMTLPSLSSLMAEPPDNSSFVAWRRGNGITYQQFLSDVGGVAKAYSSCRAAAVVCQDSYNLIVGFYGLLYAGARIVLPPRNQPAVIESLQENFDVLIDDGMIELASGGAFSFSLQPLDPTLRVIDFCTSGTTGLPKLVTKSLEMFDGELAIIDQILRKEQHGGKVLATVPHQHVYGFTFKILWALATGRAFATETYALWESLLPELTADSIIVSSPAHLDRLGGLEPLSPDQQAQLILSAGAPLSLEASLAAQSIFGIRPIEIFGSTETGAIATRSLRSGEEPWSLLPSLSMRCDNDGRMSIYIPFISQDWIETSDLIEPMDGHFHHLGRADRIAKIEGKRIGLLNIEEALQQLSFVKKAAVVVMNDPICIAAAVVLSDEGQAALEEVGNFRLGRQLRKDIRQAIDPEGLPRLWRFIDAFPNQSMGKRRDADIMALFCEDS